MVLSRSSCLRFSKVFRCTRIVSAVFQIILDRVEASAIGGHRLKPLAVLTPPTTASTRPIADDASFCAPCASTRADSCSAWARRHRLRAPQRQIWPCAGQFRLQDALAPVASAPARGRRGDAVCDTIMELAPSASHFAFMASLVKLVAVSNRVR